MGLTNYTLITVTYINLRDPETTNVDHETSSSFLLA